MVQSLQRAAEVVLQLFHFHEGGVAVHMQDVKNEGEHLGMKRCRANPGEMPLPGVTVGHASSAQRVPISRLLSCTTAHSGDRVLPIAVDYPGVRKIHDKPAMYIVEDFLSKEECKGLIEFAKPLLQRSKTHAISGSEATHGRTSLTCHLAKTMLPAEALLSKIQSLTGKPYNHMELPQVARYVCAARPRTTSP